VHDVVTGAASDAAHDGSVRRLRDTLAGAHAQGSLPVMEMEFKDTGRRRTLVLVIGVLLAIAAFAATFYLSSRGGDETAALPTRDVVVAAVPIPIRATIEASQLTIRTVPEDASNANAFADPADVVGKVAAVSIYQFQPISPNLLATGSRVGGVSILKPDETIAPDSPIWRAASINIPPERAAGGFAEPGQHVDLLGTVKVPIQVPQEDGTWEEVPTEEGFYSGNATKLMFTDIELLAKDTETNLYVFKVDAHQAEEIAHLQTEGSQFSLVLRPDGDNRDIDRSTYGETIDRIFTQYNLPVAQLPDPAALDAGDIPLPSAFPTPFPNVPYLSPSPSPSAEASPGTSPAP
jgi:Flp pilus assembly protein CpaB